MTLIKQLRESERLVFQIFFGISNFFLVFNEEKLHAGAGKVISK